MRAANPSLLLLANSLAATASPVEVETRQSCPGVHVFGARETTVGPGYGSSGTVVDLILGAYPGSTSEAITYPACGGQGSCGGISYSDSANQGTVAVASAVNSLNSRCPDTKIVLVGYSQGGQIMDNALCGNPSVTISASAVNMVKAAIFMGDPRYIAGLPYNVGTCSAQGFDPRPAGFTCPSADKVQSYCDAADPYCCTGNDQNTHQGYGSVYGQAALNFVKSKLDGSDNSGGETPTDPGDGGTPPPSSGCAELWGQCGGSSWSGPSCCSQGTCQASNEWYSQCLN